MNELCFYCDQPMELEVLEVWSETREFMFMTCCEGLHEAVVWDLQGGSREPWVRQLFADCGIDVRQIYADDGQLLLDWGLTIGPVSQKEAKAFVRKHHRHNPPPAGWRWGHGCYNGGELIAVAMVGRPVARQIDQERVVEVNRLCVNASIAPALVWNACSMLYGAAGREAKRRCFERIITYTLADEAGTTLKAVGWTQAATTKGGTWNRTARPRHDKAPTCRKIRWEKPLT